MISGFANTLRAPWVASRPRRPNGPCHDSAVTDRRARPMLAALGFLRLEGERPPVLHALHRWLDCWPGNGDIAGGMAREGYDLQLTRYDARGWRATFYTSGMEHSPTSATGTAWERTPWRAVQGVAWEALGQADEGKR